MFSGLSLHILVRLLWPGKGWPELGLLGPTPPDLSHHRRRSGTVTHKYKRTKAMKRFLGALVIVPHYTRGPK